MATQVAFTVEQLAQMPDDGTKHEIDRGELITMTLPNRRHGRLQVRMAHLLSKFLEGKELGELVSESGFILARHPDTLRGPDLAFIRAERLIDIPETGWVPGGPDLVVEIVSPSDRAKDLERKTEQYLAAGSLAVWIVYPESESVHIFEPNGVARVVKGGQIVQSESALPGFAIPALEIFA